MPEIVKTGVAHGRFQIVHYDHTRYIMAAKARCEHLVVGITNPDPTLTKHDDANPARDKPEANVLTYYERYKMLQEALQEQGLSSRDFSVVPFPINLPELYKYYVPLDATFFITIYDAWGEKKLRMFQAQGLKTEVLWRKPPAEKGISAADVRRLIAAGEPWRHLVPPAVARMINETDLAGRLGIAP
jgi:cytidyltransferase-like protein